MSCHVPKSAYTQEGKYKNGLIAKLSMKVADYYKEALKAANGMDFPAASYFPQVSSPGR